MDLGGMAVKPGGGVWLCSYLDCLRSSTLGTVQLTPPTKPQCILCKYLRCSVQNPSLPSRSSLVLSSSPNPTSNKNLQPLPILL